MPKASSPAGDAQGANSSFPWASLSSGDRAQAARLLDLLMDGLRV